MPHKMVADNGGAPCVWRGLLSLAICKPMIRKSAIKDDIVLGFGGKSRFPGEPLIYIAKVTTKPNPGEYYREPKHSKRPDCIYREIGSEAHRKPAARFHTESDERKKDVGLHFENAHVLLSDDFRYFGNKATDDYKKQFRRVKGLIETLKRGHRVNHAPELYEELLRLVNQAWRDNSQKQIGVPNDSDKSLICSG